ncbi:cytochrome c-type biogenesis protein [Dokdonella sp.]|uniref:cytochrome c-type biogenesis protein n=1 Tax=Dokdonella sp. TaxID=2291710 RepID=UPI0027B9F697|nr:cytochrome c-type biogenesis protein [Dokdonella sp.]
MTAALGIARQADATSAARPSPRHRSWLAHVLLALCLTIATLAVAAVDPLPFADHAQEVRFQNLAKQLRCLVCQNESLQDSSAPLAADLRREVFMQMQAGKSDEQIKAWLTERYSDFVLYDPPLRTGTSLLWFGPALIVLIGGAIVFATVRKRSLAHRADHPPPPAEDDW